MTRPEILELMAKSGINPIKDRGQNFLTDFEVINKAVSSAEIKPGELVVEIGPGFGLLTDELLKAGAKVVAIEMDQKLAGILRERFVAAIEAKQLTIIENDVLKVTPEVWKIVLLEDSLPTRLSSYKLIANIPYNITSLILEKFLFAKGREVFPRPAKIVLLVQKEVAERMAHIEPKLNRLGAVVNIYGRTKILTIVKKGSFIPQPKIDSALIKIDLKNEDEINDLLSLQGQFKFETFVAKLFSEPRKKIGNVLGISDFPGLDLNLRAEDLKLAEVMKLFVGIVL